MPALFSQMIDHLMFYQLILKFRFDFKFLGFSSIFSIFLLVI